jgi:hypothetical protein
MKSDNLAMVWSGLIGIVLVVVGLLGFVDNPIVGNSTALFATGSVHNIVHVLTGLLGLYIAFGLKGEMQINGVIGFGVLYAIIFIVLLISPNLFGLFSYSVNLADQGLHVGLAVISLAIGYMGRSAAMTSRPAR